MGVIGDLQRLVNTANSDMDTLEHLITLLQSNDPEDWCYDIDFTATMGGFDIYETGSATQTYGQWVAGEGWIDTVGSETGVNSGIYIKRVLDEEIRIAGVKCRVRLRGTGNDSVIIRFYRGTGLVGSKTVSFGGSPPNSGEIAPANQLFNVPLCVTEIRLESTASQVTPFAIECLELIFP